MFQFTKERNNRKINISETILLTFAILIQTNILFGAPRLVKVGAISMEATHRFSSSLETKINQVAPVIAEAGRLNLDIVALPEAYFRGKSYASDAQELNNSVVLDSMKVFARENNINILFQVFEFESETDPTRLYNTAVLVDRNGDYVGKYRKVNLPPEESSLTPGDSFPVFDLDFGKIGILICWDGWFTEPAKTLVNKGAELIFIPTWCNILSNLNTITAENGVPVSYAVLRLNCGAMEEDVPSSVYNHHGDPVFFDHPVEKNKIAIGTVTLGNYKNLALNKSVQTSSGTYTENPGAYAVDGLYSTERDAPADSQTSWKASSLPQWIEIDLGQDYAIDRVSIAQFNTEDYEYLIEGKPADGDYEILSDSTIKFETILEHGIAGSEILSSRFDDGCWCGVPQFDNGSWCCVPQFENWCWCSLPEFENWCWCCEPQKKIRYMKLTVNSSTNDDVIINEIKVFGYIETSTDVNDGSFGSTQKDL